MGVNPIPVAVALVLLYGFQALMLGADGASVGYPEFEVDEGGGFLEPLVAAFQFLGESAIFVFQFLSFQLIGIPAFIGVPIAVGLNGTLIWAIMQLVRGV